MSSLYGRDVIYYTNLQSYFQKAKEKNQAVRSETGETWVKTADWAFASSVNLTELLQ